MVKQIMFGFLSLFGLSTQASDMIELSQAAILNDKNYSYIVIDVRSTEEFADGHIPRAINIPLSEISSNLDQFHSFTDKEIVLYCRSGYRANKAAGILSDNGFSKIHHLEGDILGWVKSGLAIEK
ncbi:rhodanese-like domain-containing protein [Paraglaciecola marina]|uniref:rhodanese-like domain-containing protein n=1 Tax=Paraglaciecola marina TaxID=2500157 RepID=UPI00106038C8|nr:rhodanese-like domain-containing protein [Paraglaciecola marina]